MSQKQWCYTIVFGSYGIHGESVYLEFVFRSNSNLSSIVQQCPFSKYQSHKNIFIFSDTKLTSIWAITVSSALSENWRFDLHERLVAVHRSPIKYTANDSICSPCHLSRATNLDVNTHIQVRKYFHQKLLSKPLKMWSCPIWYSQLYIRYTDTDREGEREN